MTKVIAIAVVENEGKLLVGVRPEGVRFAGLDEFPGGKVEAGETPEQAAERECREETGLSVAATARLLSVDDHGAGLTLHFIGCRVVGGECSPRPPFRWVTREALATCQFPPANAGVLELLQNTQP